MMQGPRFSQRLSVLVPVPVPGRAASLLCLAAAAFALLLSVWSMAPAPSALSAQEEPTAAPSPTPTPVWQHHGVQGGALYAVDAIPAEDPEEVGDIQRVVAGGNRIFVSSRADTESGKEAWVPFERGPTQIDHMITNDEGVILARDRNGENWRSDRGGATWRSVRVNQDEPVRFVGISDNFLKDQQALAITTSDWRLYRFDLRSDRWIEVVLKSGERHLTGAADFSPVFESDEFVLVGTEQGIFRSEDSGQLWDLVSTPESGAPIFGPQGGPAESQGLIITSEFGDDPDIRYDIDDRTVFAYNQDGVHRSDDGGATWRRLPYEGGPVRDLAVSNGWPADPVILLAVDDPGHIGAVSRDGGDTWSWIDGPEGIIGTAAAMALDFGVRGFDIWYSEDTVSIIHLPYVARNQPRGKVEVWPGTRQMYLATDGDGLWYSEDAGRSWNRVRARASLDNVRPTSIVYLPGTNDREVLLGSDASGLYRSSDGGKTWVEQPGLPRGTGQTVHRLVTSPNFAADQTVFAGASSGLWVSRDAGRSWRKSGIDDPVKAVALSPNFGSDRTMVAAGRISRDGGNAWAPVSGVAFDWTAAAFSPRFAEDQTLWVGGAGDESFEEPFRISRNGGESWSVVNVSPLRRRVVNDISVLAVAADPLRIFVASSRGLVMSTDGGEKWTTARGTSSIDMRGVETRFVQQPVTTGVVFAAGNREAVWSTDRGVEFQSSPRDTGGWHDVTLLENGAGVLGASEIGVYRFEQVFGEAP